MTRREHARLTLRRFLHTMAYLVEGPDLGRPPTPEESERFTEDAAQLRRWGHEIDDPKSGIRAVFETCYTNVEQAPGLAIFQSGATEVTDDGEDVR